MRQEGTVVTWKDDRGFGFIQPRDSGQDIFFNLADFRSQSGARPHPRMHVTYDVIHVGGKGPRAMAVRPAGEAAVAPAPYRGRVNRTSRPQRGRPARSSGAAIAVPLMLVYFGSMLAAVWRGGLPLWVPGASFILNLLAFYAYWQDKYKASRRAWRISEQALHIWSLIGGWPGAWVAQQVLRHKSAKATFLANYWTTAVMHCAAFGAVLWWRGVLPI